MESILIAMASAGGLAIVVVVLLGIFLMRQMVIELLSFSGGGFMLTMILMVFGWMGFLVFRLVS
jgi:hypothetical protein